MHVLRSPNLDNIDNDLVCIDNYAFIIAIN